MKINVTISNGLTIEAEKNDGFIPSSVVGINTLELFFIEENYKGVVYKSMIRVPLLSEYLNDQDVLLVKKLMKICFLLRRLKAFLSKIKW